MPLPAIPIPINRKINPPIKLSLKVPNPNKKIRIPKIIGLKKYLVDNIAPEIFFRGMFCWSLPAGINPNNVLDKLVLQTYYQRLPYLLSKRIIG
jgi:hypothetical protein